MVSATLLPFRWNGKSRGASCCVTPWSSRKMAGPGTACLSHAPKGTNRRDLIHSRGRGLMTRRIRVIAVVVALTASSSLVQAQASFFAGGLGTMPMGKYGDYASIGWMAMAGGSKAVSGGEIRVDGQFGINKHDSEFDGYDASTTLIGAIARYVKPIGSSASGFRSGNSGSVFAQQESSSMSPYLHAGGGVLLHKYNPPAGIEGETSSQIVLSFGAGLTFGKALFGEAAYNHGLDETTFLSFGLGFRFGGK